ncbi:MAG: cell division protein FtsA [Bacillaceae bacterium]|nr:cell division protein FtsA [Bacillaceae bacterium]
MSSNEYIVSLDIGTSKVRVIIGEINNGSINIIGVGSADSHGIKKGAIVDIDQTVQSIREAVDQAERMVDVTIDEVVVGITGNHIELQPTQGVVAVSNEDREIGDEDIDRVMQASKVVAIPPEREIIDVVPREFVVDGLGGIRDPRGMIGVRLEMMGTIITGSKTVIHNLLRCVNRAGLTIMGLYLQPLASSQIALSDDEKNMGVVLVDIGKGITTVSLFEQGILAATSVLPVGGEYITNDIAIGLRTETGIAEQLQQKYGCALIDEATEDEVFKVKRIGSDLEKEFTQVDLASIIEPRVAEIFNLVDDEVSRLGYQGEIPGGYVITGGVASMPGVLELAREELQSSVRVAVPDYIGVRSPSFTNGVGLIKYAISKLSLQQSNASQNLSGSSSRRTDRDKGSGMIERVKNWFSEFI